MGLPLTEQASTWLQRVVPPRACHCIYARLPDALPVSSQLERAIRLTDLRSVGKARDKLACEVVSNCRPLDSCNWVIRNISERTGYAPVLRSDAEVAAHVQTLKAGLGLSSMETAALMYDQYRCASCQTMGPSTGDLGAHWNRPGGSGRSSFYQAMLRLHRRLR